MEERNSRKVYVGEVVSNVNDKTITVKGNANVSKKISKLKTGKKYYVKVRAYKSLTGYKTVYGNWSAVRSVVVK